MKTHFFVAAIISFSASAHAEFKSTMFSDSEGLFSYEPVVPVVAGDSDILPRAGLLYYDVGVGLKIVNPSGDPETVSTAGSNPVSSGGTERVERATVTYSGGTPSISSQSGTWVSVTDSGTGIATMNIVSSTFSVAPTCVVSAQAATGKGCNVTTAATTTSFAISCFNTNNGAAEDQNFYVLCMGAR